MHNTPIVSRAFTHTDGTTMEALLFAPQPAGTDWFCRIQMGDFEPQDIYGVDSLQALSLALVALVSQLRGIERACPGAYQHLGSPSLTTDLGFDLLQKDSA